VRVGNAAYPQLQLDSYGELMDFIYLYNKYGEPISCQLWENLQWLVGWIVEHWRLPDEGIWEVRGGRQEFLHSRLMCWVAVDRAIRLAERRSFPYPIDKWRATRDEIYRDTMRTFWDPTRNLRPAPRDARGRRLEPPDADGEIHQSDRSALAIHVARAHNRTGRRLPCLPLPPPHRCQRRQPGDEGTFTMCSFWYTEVLARAGDPQQARFLFEKMLGYANHLGLYAEEVGPHGEHLGNFPQALTHLALISAAYAIYRKLSDAGWIG
jgi:GH15 family glucan-1,4-alpha-glucosidase